MSTYKINVNYTDALCVSVKLILAKISIYSLITLMVSTKIL